MQPIEIIRNICPASDSPADLATYGRDWLKDYHPQPLAIAFPENTEQAQRLVQLARNQKIALVPSGGRTGLSGGATATNGELVVSLARMHKVLWCDPAKGAMRVQAGVVTEQVMQTAQRAGLFFPVDFASKGSSQIGGNIATNVGGIRVVKYGNIRNWVRDITLVTGTGEVLTLGKSLVKNQTGYDLKHLIIGSEGTLGIITEAELSLCTPPLDVSRAFIGFSALEQVYDFFVAAQRAFLHLSAFELVAGTSLEKVCHFHQKRPPFTANYPWNVVLEVEKRHPAEQVQDQLQEWVAERLEKGDCSDAIVSQHSKQADELLSLRELISETLSRHFTLHKNDISVAPERITACTQKLLQVFATEYPGFAVEIFGHVGDGNLHLNVLKPAQLTDEAFFAQAHASDHQVFEVVRQFGGSISAEHGVGLLKRDFLHYSRSATEIEILRGIKRVFDPDGILNPGKIF